MNKVAKYFLCIFFSILAVNFIISMTSFFSNLSTYLIPAEIEKNPKSETLISIAQDLESTIDDTVSELKTTHGKDYPALGIVYYKSIQHFSSVTLVQNFLFSLVCGFGLGNIIYLIFIEKLKTYKLTAFIILAMLVTALFVALADILTFVANAEEIKFGLPEIFWNMELCVLPFLITTLVLLAVRKIYSVYTEIRNS